jgi:hypothetical protein
MAEELISAFVNGDIDTQLAVFTAIEAVNTPTARNLLIEVRDKSLDQEVVDSIDEVI